MRRWQFAEGEILAIPAEQIPVEQVLDLHRRYGSQLDLTFPNPLNAHCYQMRSRGIVGLLPFGQGAVLEIQPQVNSSIFMSILECCYRLPKMSNDNSPAKMGEIYEIWAEYTADKIIERIKRGLYNTYKSKEARTPWVRGRIVVGGDKFNVYPQCRFSEHSLDVLENRIIASTLATLRRYRFKRDRIRQKVLSACRAFRGVKFRNITTGDFDGMVYHRLNWDYKLLHALCQPIMKQKSPVLAARGEEEQWPGYTIDMPSLYERFCFEYLSKKLKKNIRIEYQYPSQLKGSQSLSFRMDMALFSIADDKPLAVVDAKYKTAASLQESDVQQVVAYAVQLGVRRAYLLYPISKVDQTFEVGRVKVQTLGFDFSAANLERASHQVIKELSEVI